MNKRGQVQYIKIVLGLGLGAYIGYSIANDLGAIVGLILGGYVALKI